MADLLPNSLTPDWESTTDGARPFLFNINQLGVLKETGKLNTDRWSSVNTDTLDDDQKYLEAGTIVCICSAITSLATTDYIPAVTVSAGVTPTDYKIILDDVAENRPYVALVNKAYVNDAIVRTVSGYTAGATAYTSLKASMNTVTANITMNMIVFE